MQKKNELLLHNSLLLSMSRNTRKTFCFFIIIENCRLHARFVFRVIKSILCLTLFLSQKLFIIVWRYRRKYDKEICQTAAKVQLTN